jgi:bifunctional ADP-heptose synthase (sugar kinase/adenylyltransferase)
MTSETLSAAPTLEAKIKPLEELADIRASLADGGKRVVLCHGLFDLLYVDVIRHLQLAKELGDVLIVTLVADAQSPRGCVSPLFDEDLRAEALAGLGAVDYVAISRSPAAVDAIQALRPDVYVPWDEDPCAGPEGAAAGRTEEAILHAMGGQLVRLPKSLMRPHGLAQRFTRTLSQKAGDFLSRFASRHTAREVMSCLEKTRGMKVLFLGEAIIDEYQYCETIGKSGKEPVLAVRHLSVEQFAGGIMATANHAAAFCDHIGIVTLLGTQESHERFIREKLDPKIDATFLYVPGAPTIVKRRLVETYPFQKLFEVYTMEPDVPEAVSNALYARLKLILPGFDAVVVTDYGHGMMTPEIVELLCGQDRFLAINTQTNAANQGFNTVSKYRRANFVCISEKELRLEARSRSKDLRLIITEIAERLSCERMLITRGEQGSVCYGKGEGFFEIPTFTNRIVDRIGAGDALLAVTSLCAAQAAPIEILGFIGNVVGAQVVEIVGNRSAINSSTVFGQIESFLHYELSTGKTGARNGDRAQRT